MEEFLIVLVVVGLPGVTLSGLIIGIVALVKQRNIKRRVEELERGPSIEHNHPLASRLRELQHRVEELEVSGPPDAPPAPVDEPVTSVDKPTPEPEPVAAPTPTPATPPQPPEPPAPEEAPPSAPPSPEPPQTTPGPPAVPSPAATPPSISVPTAQPRPKIDWEQWIGVRGAAAAGGVVLALASLLFFQYSIEHGLISPTMRVALGVIAGIVCLVGSEWLVKRDQAAAANALAGAGVVILYGATWAAQNLYGLIGAIPASVLMVLITAVCVALAVSRRALFIAVLGLVGGFATPLLVASDMSSPAALFGYILLLDLGLLWLARVREWPLLSILSLVGTAIHQGLWILTSMDAERALIGLLVLGVFGLAFLFFSGADREGSKLLRATRAGGVAIPFAFALHFAGTAELAENPWPLGALLLILSAGACWLERKGGQTGAAVVAAAADIGIISLWFMSHVLTRGLAWQAVALCAALAALFTAAAEFWKDDERNRGLGLAALVSSLGFSAVLALAPVESQVIQPWPWVAGWVALGALLVLHSRWPGRSWVLLAVGAVPAFGLTVAINEIGRHNDAPEGWVWLALAVGYAIAIQVLALVVQDENRKLWADRTAAATAMAMMMVAVSGVAIHRTEIVTHLGTTLILGLLALLAATRMKSGVWALFGTLATAFFETVVCATSGQADQGQVLAILGVSVVLFTIWPALVPSAFRDSRAAWWGSALAGPLWFLVLYFTFDKVFGDDVIGLLPVALAAISLATALWLRPRLESSPAARRTVVVWYLAVALSLVSVAIPLQLENEWITIGWALNGLAILGLWARLDHAGLKYFGLALLGAATVRLVANPWVLGYHIRAATPVLNWLSYTYLVPAAALIWSHLLLRPREVDRLTGWEHRLYPVEKPIWASICGLSAVVVVFAWINLAIADLFAEGSIIELSFERMPARDTTTSVAWAIYALILLAIGVRSKSSSLRWLSLGILVLTLGKVFLHDLGELEDLYRVASLVGLAISLIIVSLIYQRFVFRSVPEDDA